MSLVDSRYRIPLFIIASGICEFPIDHRGAECVHKLRAAFTFARLSREFQL